MVLPIFKLGVLFGKTIMKPITRRLQTYARTSPQFSQSCHWLSNGYIRTNNTLCQKLRIPYRMRPVNNDQAVELGVQLVGEGTLFAGAAGFLYYEFHRNQRLPNKCDQLSNRIDALEDKLDNLVNTKDNTE